MVKCPHNSGHFKTLKPKQLSPDEGTLRYITGLIFLFSLEYFPRKNGSISNSLTGERFFWRVVPTANFKTKIHKGLKPYWFKPYWFYCHLMNRSPYAVKSYIFCLSQHLGIIRTILLCILKMPNSPLCSAVCKMAVSFPPQCFKCRL